MGLDLLGTRLRIAASIGSSANLADTSRLRYEEVEVPELEPNPLATQSSSSSLTPTLKAALSRLGVGGGRAAIAVGRPHIVLRHFVGTEGQVNIELEEVAERSLGYVQLGPGDRVTGELYHNIAEGRVHGLLAVSSVMALTPLTDSLREAGLRVSSIEPALHSLIRTVSLAGQLPSEPCFLVSADSPDIDIALVHKAHLLLSHHPSSPQSNHSDEATGAEVPTVPHDLKRELARMSRHYERAHGAVEKVRRVLVVGRTDLADSCVSGLEGSADFDVGAVTLDDDVADTLRVSPEDLHGHEWHAAAIGALAGYLPEVPEVPVPNLASEPQEKRRPQFEALIRALLVPSMVAAGLWGLAHVAQGQLNDKVATLRIETERPSLAENMHRKFQMDLIRLEQRGVQVNRLIDKYGDRHWKELIDLIRLCVPDALWLTRVRLSGPGQIVVEGATSDESLIYEFARNLEGSPVFISATVVNQNSSRREQLLVSEFVIECARG